MEKRRPNHEEKGQTQNTEPTNGSRLRGLCGFGVKRPEHAPRFTRPPASPLLAVGVHVPTSGNAVPACGCGSLANHQNRTQNPAGLESWGGVETGLLAEPGHEISGVSGVGGCRSVGTEILLDVGRLQFFHSSPKNSEH